MVQPKAPSSSNAQLVPFYLTPQCVFYVPLVGMVSFGLAALVFPELFHSIAGMGPFPEDPSYVYHFALRELLMGIQFGAAAISYPVLPNIAVQRVHMCHLLLLVSHLIMNATVMNYNPPFGIFLNVFQLTILSYSSMVYLRSYG